MADLAVLAIGIGRCLAAGHRADAVDITAILALPDAGTEAQYTVDDRPADRGPALIARVAAIGRRDIGMDEAAIFREAGIRCQEAHRATFRPGAEESALRAFQHLDMVEVEDLGI